MSDTPQREKLTVADRGVPHSGSPGDSTNLIFVRAQSGDPLAAQTLLERAALALRRWARGRLPSYARGEANTEDVVQDAVVQTLRGMSRFEHRTAGGLQAYLRTSVMNRIRDLIRRSKRRGIAVEQEDLDDEQPSPLEQVIRAEQRDRFLAALQHLRPSDRQVIVWRIELEYSIEQIASRLGKTKLAARMTLVRAIARLARHLEVERRRA